MANLGQNTSSPYFKRFTKPSLVLERQLPASSHFVHTFDSPEVVVGMRNLVEAVDKTATTEAFKATVDKPTAASLTEESSVVELLPVGVAFS